MPFEISMFWKEFGFYATGGAILAWLVWKYFIRNSLVMICDEHTKSTKYAIIVGESIRNPKHDKNNPLSREYISRHEVIEEIKRIETTLNQRCGKCPVPDLVDKQLIEFLHSDFAALQKAVDQFIADIKQGHGEIHLTMTEQKKINELILNRFDIFATEFGSKGLATIDRLASFIAGKVNDRSETK